VHVGGTHPEKKEKAATLCHDTNTQKNHIYIYEGLVNLHGLLVWDSLPYGTSNPVTLCHVLILDLDATCKKTTKGEICTK